MKTETELQPGLKWSSRDSVASIMLAVAVLLVYARAGRFDFIGFDDQAYVYQNPHITSGLTFENLIWSITRVENSNWHPLTTLSWLLMYSVFGPDAGKYHLLNVLLHSANGVLLFAFLRSIRGRLWPALAASALWVLHPLRVESVAWVSELKDVLCGTMWLLSMTAYLSYSKEKTVRSYLPVLIFHTLALLAKPMAVSLPITLLLLDFWPLRREGSESARRWWRGRVLEKIPLMLVSLGVIAFAFVTQAKSGSAQTLATFPLSIRAQNAAVSVAAYLRDTFYPTRLAVFYPHPAMRVGGSMPIGATAVATGILLLITAGALSVVRSKPYLVFGWFWFLATLVPVIGFVQLGEQARADRYTYFPAMGLTVALVWLVSDLVTGRPRTAAIALIGGFITAGVLAASTYVYVGYWKNTVTLFEHADHVVPANYLAKSILAYSYHQSGNDARAVPLAAVAARLSPTSPSVQLVYGWILRDTGQLDQAAAVFDVSPPTARFAFELGVVRARQADLVTLTNPATETALRESACGSFRTAMRYNGNYPEAQDALAVQNARLGRVDSAKKMWIDLISANSGFGPAHGNLADLLFSAGDFVASEREYQLAISAGERNSSWMANLAYLVATASRSTTDQVRWAMTLAEDAQSRSTAGDPGTLDALAACQARLGLFDDAVTTAESAVRLSEGQKNARIVERLRYRLTIYKQNLPYIVTDR